MHIVIFEHNVNMGELHLAGGYDIQQMLDAMLSLLQLPRH